MSKVVTVNTDDLFHTPVYQVQQSSAGHHVLTRDGWPVAQGSMQTISLNPGYKRWMTPNNRSNGPQ